MHYVIVGRDHPNSLELRMQNRPAHLARLTELDKLGKLVVAGPTLGSDHEDMAVAGITGSVIVAEFESLQAAENWAADDPYRHAGVYASVSVQPFRKVLPS